MKIARHDSDAGKTGEGRAEIRGARWPGSEDPYLILSKEDDDMGILVAWLDS